MKVLKYFLVFVLIIAGAVTAWLYYPQYQIHKMKKQAIEVNTGDTKISYIHYFQNKKEAQVNHLAIGDSIIRGVGAGHNENLVYQFSERLEKQIHKKVYFQNEGINGITSSELKQLVEEGKYNPELKKADIITINVGGNDILQIAKKHDYQNIFQTIDKVQTTFSKNLSDITATIKKINPKATIIFMELYNPLPSDHPFYSLADKLLPSWNLKIYQIARQNLPSLVVQTTKVINGGKLENLSSDGIHPNSAGYTAISEQMIYQFKHQYRKEAV